MDVLTTVTEFKQHLQARGYAISSINLYLFYLHRFRHYLEMQRIDDLRQVSQATILAYRETVMAQPLATETKALKVRAVKRLFEYLAAGHKLLIDPTEQIVETCRVNRKIQPVLTLAEIKGLLSIPNLSLAVGIRNRAILEVFYATGIRLGELLALEVYHADLFDKVLYIRKGKGRRQRLVPLSAPAVRFLCEYLDKIRPHYARKNPKERCLFINHSGFAMTPESVRQAMRKYRLAAGITKPVSPHTLRRTCATHMLENGADIRYIQKLLGHRHLRTTQQYTRVMPVDIKKTHNKTHPNGRHAD